MSDNGNGTGEHLAQWLREAGKRALRAAPDDGDGDVTFNSPGSLHRYLEELAGRRLGSRAEIFAFLNEVAGSRPLDHRVAERGRTLRELSLLGLLAMSYLHYYYWDVQLQIAALNSVRVFVPAPPLQRNA